MAKKRRYWGGVLADMPASAVAAQAKMQEDAGLDGLLAPQLYSTPFIPLAIAATATSRIRLLSGIALAFTRSPYETALAAMDMDRISSGRFILGLGCSVRALSEEIYGMPYGKPLEHMREVVEIIRSVISKAHTGELKRYEGIYHKHDFTTLEWLSPPPPLRTNLPIWIAALRSRAVQLAAEVADGIMGHPIWSIDWAVERIQPDIAKGLERGRRRREDVELNLWLWCAPDSDEAQAIEDARPTVAFYASAEQYESFFEAHGFRDEARRLQESVEKGEMGANAHLVPDEMVRAFVLCGKPDSVRERVERAWEVADSLCLVAPAYGLALEKLAYYAGETEKLFYG